MAGRADATGIDLATPSYAVGFTARSEKIPRIREYLTARRSPSRGLRSLIQ